MIGFLLGDRRGVKQCNAILDGHVQTLLDAMMQDKQPLADPAERGEADKPMVH